MQPENNVALVAVHESVTRAMQRFLDKMDPLSDQYDSLFVPNPAILGHIVKFLAQNEIKAVEAPHSPLETLRRSGELLKLPFLLEHEKKKAISE